MAATSLKITPRSLRLFLCDLLITPTAEIRSFSPEGVNTFRAGFMPAHKSKKLRMNSRLYRVIL